jgi:NADH-quinone oxidoreductase subunit H
MPTLTAQLLVSIAVILVVIHVILITVAYLIYFERKISAYIQDRIGPNRTGFDFGQPFLKPLRGAWGLGQSIADGLKFLLKEDFKPANVDKYLYSLAPMAVITPALIGFVIIPWGGTWLVPEFTLPILDIVVPAQKVVVAGANINVGIVFLVAVASLGVYGVTLGGWAGNNKYSFLGGLRATAQMLAYEIPLGASILCVLLVAGTLIPNEIIRYQLDHGWLIFAQPLAAIVFFVSILAEANRVPFDNSEAEQELVGGYHTEYSSMRFALYFLAEYAHMITSSAFFVLLFFGGWDIVPFVNLLPTETSLFLLVLLKFAVYFGKVLTVVAFMMVVRWTIPRLRYDQVMVMGWHAMIPLAIFLVIGTSVMVFLGKTATHWMLMANVVTGVAMLGVIAALPRPQVRGKIPMYGSRFNPVPGQFVSTAPTDPMALEDHPSAAPV